VLRPSPPLPWDSPWRPPDPPIPPPPAPPAQPSIRPQRRGPTRPAPAAPPHPPSSTPRVQTTELSRTEPGQTRRRLWLVVGVLVALLCCGRSIANEIATIRHTVNPEPATVVPPSQRPFTPHTAAIPSPALTAPTTTVDGGPTTSFDLPVGTAASFTDRDGTWSVALLGVDWIDQCEDFTGGMASVVVFDIRYEVTQGGVSVVPVNDFAFVLADGTRAHVGLTSDCADPPLDYTILSAGEVRHGWIGIELPAGANGSGGTLTYGQLGTPTASWTVPARPGR